ncbi:MAG: hypothetical protein ACTSO9_07880, partial [Candidatus Helarchaeota archaeon]
MKKNKGDKLLKNKKYGIFYTPEYIVRYIVKNSVGIILNDLKLKLKSCQNPNTVNLIFKKAKKLKFLDPACGDGVFLVEILKVMKNFYQTYNEKLESLNNSTLNKLENSGLFALCNNIYGVDTDLNAINDTCKKLIQEIKSNKNIDPNFLKSTNIKVGNSLISSFDKKIFDSEKNKKILNKLLILRSKLRDYKTITQNYQNITNEINKVK